MRLYSQPSPVLFPQAILLSDLGEVTDPFKFKKNLWWSLPLIIIIMKKSVAILATVGVVAVIAAIAFVAYSPSALAAFEEDNDATLFNDWKVHNRKVYFNAEEHNYRLNVFKTNLQDIRSHNANPDKKWTKGVNMFTDLTSEEFKRLYTGAVMPDVLEAVPEELYDESNLQSSVDWTKKGAVTGVKNQGACGSCWSFSATGTLETAYYLSKGSLKSFSEQQLVDCTYGSGNYGCNGGWPYLSFKYWQTSLAEQEGSYPYTARDGSCSYSKSQGVTNSKSYAKVSASASQLMAAVNKQTVSICVDATPLQSYSGGIVTSDSCSTRIDHAVLAVGYDSVSKYFKVKNSWGSGWGESGYFRIEMGPNTCGMLGYMYTVLV